MMYIKIWIKDLIMDVTYKWKVCKVSCMVGMIIIVFNLHQIVLEAFKGNSLTFDLIDNIVSKKNWRIPTTSYFIIISCLCIILINLVKMVVVCM